MNFPYMKTNTCIGVVFGLILAILANAFGVRGIKRGSYHPNVIVKVRQKLFQNNRTGLKGARDSENYFRVTNYLKVL